jgi:hypothetical protein
MDGILDVADSRVEGMKPIDLTKINFSDKTDQSSIVLGTSVTLLVLTTLVVALRTYVRIRITGRLFADDCGLLLLPSWAACRKVILGVWQAEGGTLG